DRGPDGVVPRGPPDTRHPTPGPAVASGVRLLHPLSDRGRRRDRGPALGARAGTLRGRHAPAHRPRRIGAVAALAADARLHARRARRHRRASRAAAARGVRDRAVRRPQRHRPYGAQPAPALRGRAVPAGAGRRPGRRTLRRLAEPPRALRGHLRVPGGDQGWSPPRPAGNARAGAAAAHGDPARPRRARPAHHRAAAQGRVGAAVRQDVTPGPPLTPVVVGPTAVGKTAVVAALAALIPVTVLSADARQVYRGLDVGTAKPDVELRRRVPHLGLDLIAPGERYSAGRFARAVEVALLTGRAVSWWQREARETGAMRPWYIHLTVPRETLHRRIAERVDRMLASGLVAEVERTLAAGVAAAAPGLDGVGYREVVAVLQGRAPAAGLRDGIVIATRQYAKRQET